MQINFINTISITIIVLVGLDGIDNVEIEFVVYDTPKYYTPLTDDVYIFGSFNNWSPNNSEYRLHRLTHNQFKIALNLKTGVHEYKFTRGSWNTVETEENGLFLQSRKLKIITRNKQTIPIKILNWNDMIGNHTARGNIMYLANYTYPQFNDCKRIWVYLPFDYFYTNQSYSVLYVSDGQHLFDNFFSEIDNPAGFDETMESFSVNNKDASIIVGIENTGINRDDELSPYPYHNDTNRGGKADLYLDFLLNSLKLYIDKTFRTKTSREHTGILGFSLGGMLALYAGIKHEDVFSKIGVFSPEFSFNNDIYKFAEDNLIKYNDTKIYFAVGSLEFSAKNNEDYVVDTMKMVNFYVSKGFAKNIKYFIASDGDHKLWFWNREFRNAYSWLFHQKI